ncbi:hypothetical protein [Aestuariivirga sp.]|uniref:hypothetical protein n=1 Tax=Aestuariivirga sp. TaxID=2650926 RepID=UPI00391C8AB4
MKMKLLKDGCVRRDSYSVRDSKLMHASRQSVEFDGLSSLKIICHRSRTFPPWQVTAPRRHTLANQGLDELAGGKVEPVSAFVGRKPRGLDLPPLSSTPQLDPVEAEAAGDSQ